MQYPASFSESLGDHELKLPFFVPFLKVSFLWPRKKWMPFYSENRMGGKVLHTKPYQFWMRFAEALGQKFWVKSSFIYGCPWRLSIPVDLKMWKKSAKGLSKNSGNLHTKAPKVEYDIVAIPQVASVYCPPLINFIYSIQFIYTSFLVFFHAFEMRLVFSKLSTAGARAMSFTLLRLLMSRVVHHHVSNAPLQFQYIVTRWWFH